MKRRMVAFTISLLIALPLAVLKAEGSSKNELTSAYHPMVSMLQGDVKVKGTRFSVWEPVELGTLLLSGDILKTGTGAKAEIQFLSGTVQLYQNSVIVIPSTGVQKRKKDIKEIFVEDGGALFEINHTGVRRQFEFRTRNVQGGVKGTTFAVGHRKGNTHVVVYSGAVRVMDPEKSQESRQTLKAGNAIQVDRDSQFSRIKKFDVKKASSRLRSRKTTDYEKLFEPALQNGSYDTEDSEQFSDLSRRSEGNSVVKDSEEQVASDQDDDRESNDSTADTTDSDSNGDDGDDSDGDDGDDDDGDDDDGDDDDDDDDDDQGDSDTDRGK